MTDLHTHILPGIDDGAVDVEMSIKMLQAERDQGVDTVVLTPHFYCEKESPERFFQRREKAFETLMKKISELDEEERNSLPALKLGAEVAWWPNMADYEDIGKLCIENTNYLLLELPMRPWGDRTVDEIYNMMGKTGVMPIIAHLDRYLPIQPKASIHELFAIGVPIHFSCDALQRRAMRSKLIKFIRNGYIHFFASDCHDCDDRRPDMQDAIETLGKKLKKSEIQYLTDYADRLLKDE